MTDYLAGTVAFATVRGVPGVQIMRAVFSNEEIQGHGWVSSSFIQGWRFHYNEDVRDVEVVYTPRMAEPEPVQWQVVAHIRSDSTRRRWLRAPWSASNAWCSESGQVNRWDDLIDPEPYRGTHHREGD